MWITYSDAQTWVSEWWHVIWREKKGYTSRRDLLLIFFLQRFSSSISFIYLGSSMSILESSVTPFPNAQQHKVISRCNEGNQQKLVMFIVI